MILRLSTCSILLTTLDSPISQDPTGVTYIFINQSLATDMVLLKLIWLNQDSLPGAGDSHHLTLKYTANGKTIKSRIVLSRNMVKYYSNSHPQWIMSPSKPVEAPPSWAQLHFLNPKQVTVAGLSHRKEVAPRWGTLAFGQPTIPAVALHVRGPMGQERTTPCHFHRILFKFKHPVQSQQALNKH